MVRTHTKEDLPVLLEIWLTSNLDAHAFIPASCWEGHLDAVGAQLAQAELYVWDDGAGPQGFLGMDGDTVAGLFVRREARSRGSGRALLDAVKSRRDHLELCVYRKNTGALRFYQREGFAIWREQTDPDVGETEYVMIWER